MRKYIPQATYENFVYPNNNIAIYDNNDVVQDINSNEITGTISGFTTSLSGTTLTISFNYTWNRNGGQVFINQADRLHLFSVHMMTPSKSYYHPWRLVDYKYVTGTTQNSYTGSYTTSVTAAEYGESFTAGLYTYEIRFIGALNTDVVCATSTIVPAASQTPTPTATPTPSPSSGTPTPTPTMTLTPTPSQTSFRTIQLSNPPGNDSTAGACAVSTGLTYYIGYYSAIGSGLVIYTNSSLTTRLFNSDPLADGFYVMLYDNNSGLRYAVDFDASGDVNTAISC